MTAMVLLSDWMASQVEFWKPVIGFNDYDVSTQGRVRSRHMKSPRFLRYGHHRLGYLEVVLYRNGERHIKKVHRLVAQAFVSNPDMRDEVNHLTALKADNRSDGLEWSTRLLNIRHSFTHGLVPRAKGEHHPMAKLTEVQAREILRKLQNGERGIDLAKEYGVTKYAISGIKTRKSWSHL